MVRCSDAQYNILQMAKYEGIRLSQYVNSKFTEREMLVVLDGLRWNSANPDNSIDVHCFADNHFNYKQMYEIMEGLQEGLDVTPLLNPKITWKEMEYLKEIIKRGANPEPFINDGLTANQLVGVIKILDSANPDFLLKSAKPVNYDIKMIDDIIKFNLKESDLSKFKNNLFGLNWEFNPKQLAVIERAALFNNSIVNYVFPDMRIEELEEIAKACSANVDVRQFALPGYTCEQMQFIRQCMEEGRDVSVILKPDLSVEEMKTRIY